MPFENSLPAIVPTFEIEGFWPSYLAADEFPAGLNVGSWAWRGPGGYFNNPPNAGGAIVVDGAAAGGAGVITRYESVGGVNLPARFSTTGAIQGQLWRLPWKPDVTNPGAVPTGALISRQDFRVNWLRECFLILAGAGDGGCGRVISLDNGTVGAVNWAQAGAAVAQFGVFGNGAGGLEYRSYSSAPALLETVALPTYIPAAWNVFDWVLVSNGPNRPATFQLIINGASALIRTFGTGVLPYENGPGRVQWVQRMTVAAGQYFLNYLHLRCGKYKPDGTEVTG